MRLQAVRKLLKPRHIFQISRGPKPWVENVFVALEQDGLVGYGEASPNAYFREDAETVFASLVALNDVLKHERLEELKDIERLWHWVWPKLSPSHAAQCAFDLAMWDLLGKIKQTSVHSLVYGSVAPHSLPISATLGIVETAELKTRLQEMSGFSKLKIKTGENPNWEQLRVIKALRPDAQIAIDANAAWSQNKVQEHLQRLSELGIVLVEQPLPPSLDESMRSYYPHSTMDLYADESAPTLESLPQLVGAFHGINIKLVKCGGLTPALKMQALAKELGLKVMVGCMLETSLLIAAGCVAAQNANWADLDGAWLLEHDPFLGLSLINGHLHSIDGYGFGVIPEGLIPFSAHD